MEIPLALPPLLGISDVEQTLAPMLPTVIAAGQQFFPEACMLVEQVSASLLCAWMMMVFVWVSMALPVGVFCIHHSVGEGGQDPSIPSSAKE